MDNALKITFLSLLLTVTLLHTSCSEKDVDKCSSNRTISFFNDFETESEKSIWKNVKRIEDNSATSGNFVCECSADMLYAFGFNFQINDSIKKQNALLSFDMMIKTEKSPNAILALSIQNGKDVMSWISFPLSKGFLTENKWYRNSFEVLIPNDMLRNNSINCHILNNDKERILVDDFSLDIEYVDTPTYINDVKSFNSSNKTSKISDSKTLNLLYSDNNKMLMLTDINSQKLTKPLSMRYSVIIDGDTTELQLADWKMTRKNESFMFENNNEIVTILLNVFYEGDNPNVNFSLQSIYHQDVRILKSSLIIPFLNNDFIVYRNNPFVDTTDYQDVYYLGKEGFSVILTDKQLNIYHPDDISSIQLDTKNAVAYINTDFYLDHRLIHYPLSDTSDYYVDNSPTFMKEGSSHSSSFTISLTNRTELPRIMPVMNGYESAFIWTEHADWSDIKTHRATYFGSEEVTDIEDAVGGFAYYDIPVTKSVFYNNPDSISNYEINDNFQGLHSTIKTDDDFLDFLKQLRDDGFDICLHTPEQHTSNRDNLKESIAFMKDHFSSPSWIDHGYNNGILSNRENMVCDGLDSTSPYYVCDLWKENGVKYIWNASLEEQRPYEKYLYGSNLLRPYPGFGDAFPLPKISQHPSYQDIYMWFTPCTVEPGENWAWNYYFSQDRLNKIVDYRYVYITHIYAPWVTEKRGFWEIDNGRIVAKDGFNKTLEIIANLRDKHYLLPTTIDDYMTYQEQLLNLIYRLDSDGNVLLKNNNKETIKGLSLISTKELSLEDGKSFNRRKTKSGDEYIIWFDMEPNEELTIYN